MGESDKIFQNRSRITNAGMGVILTIGAATIGTEELGSGQTASLPMTAQNRPWQDLGFLPPLSTQTGQGEQWHSILTNFVHRIVNDTVDPIPEFDALVAKHFWDLV